MSATTTTWSEVVFAGPPASYTAGGSSSTAAFALTAGSTGNYQQPVLQGGFWGQGRSNQLMTVEGWLQVSAQASATTLTLTLVLATAPNQTTGSTLLALPALTVTSFSGTGIWFKTSTINRGSGYGTSSVSTNLQTSANYVSNATPGIVGMTQLATTDFSVNQWITLLGQFSTNSGTNSAQLNQVVVRGEN